MKLDEYLTQKDLSEEKFAELIGVSQPSVNRYRNGRVPEPNVMRKIAEVTAGSVTPNDFHGMSKAS